MGELDPEMLAACALAALFASDPMIWDAFMSWCHEHEYFPQGEEPSRLLMSQSSRAVHEALREIEIQFLAARIGESLRDINAPGI